MERSRKEEREFNKIYDKLAKKLLFSNDSPRNVFDPKNKLLKFFDTPEEHKAFCRETVELAQNITIEVHALTS